MFMKEAVSRISTYSADTFGVCSALYELGGMVVIHDPSGCNSTYATHDEPRWYDMDSLIFISGLTEMDAVMGNDDKFVHDVVAAASEFSPEFIVILRTPVPLMVGTDMESLAAEIEAQTGIMTVAAPTNNMNGYEEGISWAMEMLARRMAADAAPSGRTACSWQPEFAAYGGAGRSASPIRVNILGITPLDFALHGASSLRTYLLRQGFSVQSTWAMDCSLADIRRAGQADVNLVAAGSALAAAKVLESRFGTPYVVGLPIGSTMKKRIAAALAEAYATKKNAVVCAERPERSGDADTIVIGEGVASASLAAALEYERGSAVSVYCPLTIWDGVLTARDRTVSSERELRSLLSAHTGTIIADPLYQPVCPKAAHFVPLGHVAFSGRLYEKAIPDLIADVEGFINKQQGE